MTSHTNHDEEREFDAQLDAATKRVDAWPAWKKAALNWLVVTAVTPAVQPSHSTHPATVPATQHEQDE